MTFTKCHLHIPYKDWATPEEKNNYLLLERWTRDFYARFLASQPINYPFLDFPNKDWSGSESPLEYQNYLAIERWSRLLPGAARQFITASSVYDLFVPHKDWALQDKRDEIRESGRLEIENYLSMERWCRRFIRGCMPGGNG